MRKMRIIGLMSGTSLDGLDLIDVTIWKQDVLLQFHINNTTSIAYSKEEQLSLKHCFDASEFEVAKKSLEYGAFLGEAVTTFIKDLPKDEIDFIASHGHTVFHKPDQGITVQIGDGQVLSDVTGIEVICDFRSQDVALGGQGAPLVPIGDALLFSEYDYCLNLGGFANISFDEKGVRKAYDICPVNIVMNHYTRQIGLEYDESGKLAASGELNTEMLKALNAVPFYAESFPKSLGYEFVITEIIPLIDSFNESIPNILRTFIAHVSEQIRNNIQKENSTILVTGGGAFNTFLIETFKENSTSEFIIPSKEIIDFKEALIFALLGYLRKHEKVNCLKSVTGAKHDHSSGVIFNPKKTNKQTI